MKAIHPLHLVLLLVAPVAQATTVGDGRVVTLEEALRLAEATGAVAGAQGAARSKAQAERGLSPILGNPEVTLQQGWVDDPDPAVAGSLSQLSVSLPLRLSGRAQVQAASAETDALWVQAALQRHDRRLEVATAWLALWAVQSAAESARQEVELAAALLGKVDGAHQLGGVTRLEVAEARSHLAEARLSALEVERSRVSARLELVRTLGLASQPEVRAEGPLPGLGAAPTPDERQWLLEAASRHPAVIAQRHRVRAAEARIREARAAAGWQVSVGAQGSLQAGRYPSASGLLALTPPLFERGAREAALASAELAEAEGQLREVTASAANSIAEVLHDATHANEVHRVLETELIPSSKQAAELALLLFDNGQSQAPDVLRARRALSSAQRRLVAGRLEAARAAVRLTLLRELLQ